MMIKFAQFEKLMKRIAIALSVLVAGLAFVVYVIDGPNSELPAEILLFLTAFITVAIWISIFIVIFIYGIFKDKE